MSHALLWALSLLAGLLLLATMLAITARWPRRYGQAVGPMLVAAVVLCLSIAATVLAGYFEFQVGIDVSRFYSVLAWTICYSVGAGCLLVGGLRRREQAPAAHAWPRGPLALGLSAAALLSALTFAYIDWSVRSKLAEYRAETIPFRPVAEDNAAPLYREGVALLKQAERDPHTTWEGAWHTGEVRPGCLDPRDKALIAFVATQREGLELIRRAALRPRCCFDRTVGHDLEGLHEELHELHHAARVLALDALVCAGRGDAGQALKDVAAILAIAHQLDEPVLSAQFCAARIEEIGAAALEDVLAHVTPQAADLVAVPVPNLPAYSTRMVRALEGNEIAFGIDCFSRLAEGSSPEWDRRFDLMVRTAEVRPLAATPLYRVFYLEEDVAAYRRTMADMRALAAQPFHETRSAWDVLDHDLQQQRRGLVTALIRPNGRSCAQRAAEADAISGLSRLAFALCQYRARTGELPDRLDDLVPRYLAELPCDPFDGKTLRARRAPAGMVLYSIGPDASEEGAEADAKRQRGHLVLQVR